MNNGRSVIARIESRQQARARERDVYSFNPQDLLLSPRRYQVYLFPKPAFLRGIYQHSLLGHSEAQEARRKIFFRDQFEEIMRRKYIEKFGIQKFNQYFGDRLEQEIANVPTNVASVAASVASTSSTSNASASNR